MKNLLSETKKKVCAIALCGAFVLTAGIGTSFAADDVSYKKENKVFFKTFHCQLDKNVKVKMEDGVKLYSTDDGETWSETALEGMPVFDGIEDNLMFKMSDAQSGMKVRVKMEDGVKLYSTDDGETWSETAPEGISVK